MIQDMICSQDDAPGIHKNPHKIQEHIERCNLAWILFIKHITVTSVVADGPLTSINQKLASILAVVYVLLGRAVTEYRWGESRNILFMRHKLLVLTVKKILQSVYIYGSYRKIKTGVPFFGPPGIVCSLSHCLANKDVHKFLVQVSGACVTAINSYSKWRDTRLRTWQQKLVPEVFASKIC